MNKILLVDDEEQILKSLRRLLMDTDYEVFCAPSGEEALQILKIQDIDIVISDMRMPLMDGYQLLSIIKQQYPKVFRIILSGYSDDRIIFKALLQNVAKIYIFKPWNNDEMILLLSRLFETQKVLSQNGMLQIINNTEELPTISTSFSKIMKLIDEDADIEKISLEIEKDPSISSKILHIANSAFYGIKTGAVKQAITFLGIKNVRNLVLSTSIIDSLNPNTKMNKEVEKLWEHGFVTNKILSLIYNKCLGKKVPEIATAAGLLHNAGVALFLTLDTQKCIEVQNLIMKDFTRAQELERTYFQATHEEIGGLLLDWWELPFQIVEATLYHHEPMNPNIVNKEIVYVVHLAQYYAGKSMKLENTYPLVMNVFEALNIRQKDVEFIVDNFNK